MQNRSFQYGIREKLIIIFLLIKVIPLILLAVLASRQVELLGETVQDEYSEVIAETHSLVTRIGDLATQNSIKALDDKSREAIERLTTETAAAVADFLYQRDADIELAATLPPDPAIYSSFLNSRKKTVVYHRPWMLDARGTRWISAAAETADRQHRVTPKVRDNEKEFHYRPPEKTGIVKSEPLYLEITFFDIDGREKVKVTTSDLLPKELLDVSQPQNTWCKAEKYFSRLDLLDDDEVYVSEVIGPYISSPVIGSYTPQSARRQGIAFAPEEAGYAGRENPVGKRFQGLVRWVKPVIKDGVRVGYVSLALDHTHIMEFTDHIVPTEERYSPISDASTGNYAFMWDHKGRNISHPRDYFIVGYDSETGDPAVPWLSDELYQQWQKSGMSYAEFEKTAPQFNDQSLAKRAAAPLTDSGNLGLDCRFLNFAPQCTGWYNLTSHGGSGSFVIFWSKLWKLTTAAAIPYYTGQYGSSPRGFGFVTIGANVHEFHSAASQTARRITGVKVGYEKSLREKERQTLRGMTQRLEKSQGNLTMTTLAMILAVMFIAVWMASTLTKKILVLIRGINRFRDGDLGHRLAVGSEDEMGQLASALNEMSDRLQESVRQLDEARIEAERSDRSKGLFLTNISHEIRTPLNAIIGMTKMAIADSCDGRQKDLLQTVCDSAESLFSLLNDILDFSKVEAGEFELEPHTFDLHQFILSAARTAEALAEQQGLRFSYSIGKNVPQTVVGDGLRLKQILLNILGNAVKFTTEGQITMTVDGTVQPDDSLRLLGKVEDSGIGIPEEMKEEIFKGFTQVDATISRQHQGIGLGLALTRKLCQLMDGDVTVERSHGRGSTIVFTVVMQLPDVETAAAEKDGRVKTGGDRRVVLVVEDNTANRILAKMILEKDGCKVLEAGNGEEALETLAATEVDAIFMDIQMPVLDGLATTRIIRALEDGLEPADPLDDDLTRRLQRTLAGKHHPIIVLTAHAMSGDREKCLAAGADRYLTKPFAAEHILAVLDEL